MDRFLRKSPDSRQYKMIIYDGTYRWHERGKARSKSFKHCTLSCRLRIIDLSMSQPEVKHLKPFIVVAAETSESPFKTSCAESLGKRICKDFNLDINHTIWIEYSTEAPRKMHTAIFIPKYYSGFDTFYSIN